MADKSHNPLGLSEPYTKDQVKALGENLHARRQRAAWVSSQDISARFANTSIDYATKVGDVSLSSLVMSAVRWAGNTIPEAPLMVKKPGTKEADAEEVPGHRLTDLLRKPNAYYAGDNLWTAFAFSWIADGNVYFLKVRDRLGRVVELWYEPHWTIRPRHVNDGRGGYIRGANDDPNAFINYYEVDRGGRPYRVEASDVIHFRDGIDPYDQRRGWSYIKSIYREIYGDNEVSNFSARLLGGSAVPPFLLKISESLPNFSQEDANALASHLKLKTSGDQRGEPLVVHGGEPIKLAWSPEEMDLKVLHRFSEERFCAVTGIPAAVLSLGVANDFSTYNNIREATARAYEAFLIPLYRRIASQLNVQLLPDFERENSALYVTHDLSGVRALQEDDNERHERVRADFDGGIMTLDEARSKVGLAPARKGLGECYSWELKAQRAAETQEDAREDQRTEGQQGARPVQQPSRQALLRLVKSLNLPSKREEEDAMEWFERMTDEEAKAQRLAALGS